MSATAPPLDARTDADGKNLTIIEHLQELRSRVVRCVLALIVGVGVSIWPLTKYAIQFLVQPAKDQLPGFKLHQFQLLDYWSTYFRVSLLLGIAIAMPVIVYQVLAFVAPGLTPRERRWLYPIVVGATAMFVTGMAFGYYLELPPALRFLLKPNTPDVESTIGVQTYIDTVTRLLLITGLVFEMPFLIMGLAKIGLVTSRRLLGWTRYAIVLSAVMAAVVTPSVDPITMLIVMVPIVVLYFIGVVLAKLVEANSLLGARE
ncbi:MAG: twin-arginine translocase subunit TatC [Chloroflexi bacterium]|nr:twin-arginine translocase subunit TatC [Chloroflexota bacterium]